MMRKLFVGFCLLSSAMGFSQQNQPKYKVGVLGCQASTKVCSKSTGNCRRRTDYRVDTPEASYSFVHYGPLNEPAVLFDKHSYVEFRLSEGFDVAQPSDYSAYLKQKSGKEIPVEIVGMSEDTTHKQ